MVWLSSAFPHIFYKLLKQVLNFQFLLGKPPNQHLLFVLDLTLKQFLIELDLLESVVFLTEKKSYQSELSQLIGFMHPRMFSRVPKEG